MKNGQGGDGCLAFQKISHKKQINKNASKSANGKLLRGILL